MTRAALNRLLIRTHAITLNPTLWLTVIAAATLLPSADRDPGLTLCLICGERGGADAIANLALFFPLGYALAHRLAASHGKYTALALPLIITLAVEGLQILIPGRNPSLSDVVFNSLGGWLGYWVGSRAARGGPHSQVARRWWAYGATVVGILVLTAALVAPAPSEGIYFGQWTAEFDDTRYGGQVLQTFVGNDAIPDAAVLPSSRLRAALLNGESIRILAVAGPAQDRLAALFSVADHRGVFNLFIGFEHDDVVFEYRTRASALRLDQLRLRARGLAGTTSVGDTLRFELAYGPAGVSFWLNGIEARPGIPHLGMGWQLLFGSSAIPPWLESWLNAGWIAICLALMGYASTDFLRLAAAAVAILVLFVVLPAVSWLVATPAPAYVALVAGLTAGRLFRINPSDAR